MSDKTSPKTPTEPSLGKDPFSEEELNKFHLRAAARVKKFKESIRQTVEDHKKPLSERRKV